jgi:hypothetical protein
MADDTDYGFDETTPEGDSAFSAVEADTPTEMPSAFEIPDEAFVKVKVNGEEKLLPWKEARAGVMFQQAFTQKTQDLARQRQEFDQQSRDFGVHRQNYEQRLASLNEVLQNPQQLAALYMHAASLQQGQAPQGPQPLTTDYLPMLEQTLEQKFSRQMSEYQAKQAQGRQAERYEADLATHMKGILTNHPLLRAMPDIEDTVYGRVAKMGVTTIEEAKEQARILVDSLSLQVQKAYSEQQKRTAVDKAKAMRNGIEPRGGQAPLPKRANVNKLEDLDNDFLQYLQTQDRAEQA